MSNPLDLMQDDVAELETAGAAGNVVQTCPAVKIEYGVFFDGTGNNEANYLTGKDMRAHGQKTSDSYDNDHTNVVKLQKHYKGSRQQTRNDCGSIDTIFRSKYIQGAGTTAAGEDDNMGLALGMGETGVWYRVAQAFVDIREELFQQAAKGEISEITFDIFGFSRGAAAARHFANLLKATYPFIYQGDYQYFNKYPNHERIIFPMSIVKIRFIGLFDCVVSTGYVADDDNYPGLRIGLADDLAEKVVNLRAADEFRENFSSTSVLANSDPKYGGKEGSREEFVGPGAHSDIGGGYAKHFREAPVIDLVKAGKNEGVYQTGMFGLDDHSDIDKHMAGPVILDEQDFQRQTRLINEQWIYRTDVHDTYRKIPTLEEGYTYFIVLDRSDFVDHRLSRIYLHIMHELALEAGVAFLPNLPSGPDYDIPPDPDLQVIKEKVKNRQPLTVAETLHVKRNYVHHSAHYAHSEGGIGGFFGIRPMVPQAGNIRTIYPNDP